MLDVICLGEEESRVDLPERLFIPGRLAMHFSVANNGTSWAVLVRVIVGVLDSQVLARVQVLKAEECGPIHNVALLVRVAKYNVVVTFDFPVVVAIAVPTITVAGDLLSAAQR